MKVHALMLHNYRNYKNISIELSPNINILIGLNAQGKTNILEALYYASMGHSHRTNSESDLIKWEADEGAIQINFERFDVANHLAFHFSREKRRQIMYNGQSIQVRELIGLLNAVLFSPEDLFLIKGAPAGRRRFLDNEISQASPAYYHELSKYTRIVTQRNTLLKRIREHKAKPDMLDLWDQQLAVAAAAVVERRLVAVKKLNMLANLMQRRISANKENLTVRYDFNGMEGDTMTEDLVSWYNNKLKESVELDIIRGVTTVGPHRDDIILEVNGINLRSFGSQGQQRTGVLALKLAELEFIRSETGEYPILLLDDVMSELDVSRREQLLQFICREHIQTVITATDEAYFPPTRIGRYYKVKAGTIAG
jgi:DNA replication and repair protein RecF